MIMKRLFSIGHLAANLQLGVEAIREIAAQVGIIPDCEINGIVYFDADGVEQIRRAIQEAAAVVDVVGGCVPQISA